MRGEPIEAIKVGLETMVSSLRQDPFALESVHLSVITFNRSPEQILPLTEFEQYAGTGLEQHQDALTKEDKRMLGKLTARYSKVRAKAFGKQLQESLEDVHNFIDGFLEGLSDDANDNNNQ